MKKKLIFDVSILIAILQKNSSRSGILWVGYNVITELLRQDKFDLYLYCAPDRMRELLFGLNRELSFLKGLPIINIEPQKVIKSSGQIDLFDYKTFINEYSCESWGVWTAQKATCSLLLDVAEINDLEISIDLQMVFKPVTSYSVTGESGEVYAQCPSDQRVLSFKIPLKDIKDNRVIFHINAEGASSPKDIGLSGDTRVLGLGIKGIWVTINEENPPHREAPKPPIEQRYIALRERKNRAKRDKKYIALLFRLSLMVLYKIYFRFQKATTTVDNSAYQEYLKECELFLSPMFRVPDDIAKMPNIRKYVILHDLIPFIFDNYNRQSAEGWLKDLVNSINSTDHYFSNSKNTRKDFIHFAPKISPENVTVIPLSTGLSYAPIKELSKIDAVKKRYKIPANKRYALSMCTLEPRKNLIFAAKNFIKFVNENKIDDLIFVLGGGHWAEFMDELNKALEGIKDSERYIKHIGYVDDEDMNALYSGAEFFIYMSLYEGFGMPILEAMKSGCPIICSNVSSIPEVVGDTGIQVSPHSDDDFIQALDKMYSDKQFRESCIEKGLKRAEIFSWENAVDTITKEMMG
ncbi:MAG: glycosyltransferase family 4 protein [Deferribacteraceae bacterium]|jgi:glycosyltransferase involved in cell wall biosynthesis|nr:glycosyltransferase family 4 protein [Deferribacteraceae bacterium]